MTSKPPNINQNERHLTQLNMPEVCLDKTIESCLKLCCENFADAAENSQNAE